MPKDWRGISVPKEQAYKFACPFCGAASGRSCFQVSHYKRTGERKYSVPHTDRLHEIEKHSVSLLEWLI